MLYREMYELKYDSQQLLLSPLHQHLLNQSFIRKYIGNFGHTNLIGKLFNIVNKNPMNLKG